MRDWVRDLRKRPWCMQERRWRFWFWGGLEGEVELVVVVVGGLCCGRAHCFDGLLNLAVSLDKVLRSQRLGSGFVVFGLGFSELFDVDVNLALVDCCI
jgi:hypothetical protein